ncbi:sugar phosphate isomerase/epimerase family protein [Compostibacter hankyongensis]|uniref:Xylose isomerase-like TIM barrel domain-containing protein n=1 Tax=Compostibacter hankyongensis TaxID=1007089 RepID=A0ABP8G2Q8_9BACT
MSSSRRLFLKTASLGVAATAVQPVLGKGLLSAGKRIPGKQAWQTGIAGFTFAQFNLDDSLQIMKRLDVHDLSIKDFHLPLDSTPQQISAVVDKCKASDVRIYAVGVIYMKSKAEVDRAFAYAKQVGVPLIIGVPTYDLLSYSEQKVKESGIRLAIHNHGPEDKLYPAPGDVYKRIKNMDERVGLCLDIGHSQRAGTDPAAAAREYGPRIFDLHIKDVTAAKRDGQAIPVGRGIIDFPALMLALQKIGFKGHCSMEYERDMKDPLAGLAESVGYLRGVAAGTLYR